MNRRNFLKSASATAITFVTGATCAKKIEIIDNSCEHPTGSFQDDFSTLYTGGNWNLEVSAEKGDMYLDTLKNELYVFDGAKFNRTFNYE